MPEKFIPHKRAEDYMNPEQIPTSNRGLDKYLSDLNLTTEMLAKKRILDLGSGTGRFAKEIHDKQINSDVISIDPTLKDPTQKAERGAPEILKQLSANRLEDRKAVVAVGENLPFKDNSFDLILAEYSLPAHATSEQQIDEFFKEALRVLRLNGELRFVPHVNLQRAELSEYINQKLSELSNNDQYKVIKEGQLTIIRKLQ